MRFFNKAIACAILLVIALSSSAFAQQLNQQRGQASRVDLIKTAQQISMQDMYARALYLHLRANPQVLENQSTLVNFIVYLMTQSPGFECRGAFENEFDRRDFFTRAIQLKDQLRQVISTVQIPQSFEIAYTINTGAYKFEELALPFDNTRAVSISEGLSSSVSTRAQSCASQILQGSGVETRPFPWQFEIINETGERRPPTFPFGRQIQMPADDARVLFSQFGRQLYAVVSYQFQAANDGTTKIQVIPTDGQLFGLSANSVVAVKPYRHPQLSRPNYLDMTNPIELNIGDLKLSARLVFEQSGFRAVGAGTREDPGTGITLGGEVPVTGSAAVGGSMFIMRLHAPQLDLQARRNQLGPSSEKYLTLIGSINFEKITAGRAPVSGNALILEVDPASGQMLESQPMYFSGAFTPKAVPDADPVPAPSSETPVEPIKNDTSDGSLRDL